MKPEKGESRPVVLVIDNSPGKTGALTSILNMAEHLRDRWEFIFLLPLGKASPQYVRMKGFTVEEIAWRELSRRPFDLLLYPFTLLYNGWRVAKLARRRKARIIHSNDLYNLAGIIAKFLQPRLRLITHIRILPQAYPRKLYRMWVWAHKRSAAHILAVSPAAAEAFANSPKLRILPDAHPSEENLAEANFSSTPPLRCLYLSHFIQGKGQDIAIKAVSKAFENKPDLKLELHLYGGDLGMEKNRQFRVRLQEEVKKAKHEAEIRFYDQQLDPEALYKSYDLLINASESESFSMTTLEAMYYGIPVLATDSGGPRYIIEDGVSGWLVPNRDAHALALKLLYIAENPESRRLAAQNARKRAREAFNPEKLSCALEEVYRTV